MAMVFTGGRRDLNYHGWLELEGLGRAKFTDGVIVGLEPWDEEMESLDPANSVRPPLSEDDVIPESRKPGSGLARLGAEAGGFDFEFSRTVPQADPSGYLRAFFKELNKLKPPQSWARSHAITYQKNSLCILISVGDCRRKVFVEKLDPDPAVAAEKALELWERAKDGNSPSDFD